MHYFSPRPDVPSAPQSFTVTLPDGQWTFTTDTGVFSRGRLDPGTQLLLEKAPAPAINGDILDLGCGWGAIAVVLAKRFPKRHVWAVDVNERALELTRQNAEAAKVQNVTACLPHELPGDTRFAAIYSNPPIAVGKTQLHGMLSTYLQKLATKGSAYLVVSKHLGSDSLSRWLEDQGYETARLVSRRGYRILEVKGQSYAENSEYNVR